MSGEGSLEKAAWRMTETHWSVGRPALCPRMAQQEMGCRCSWEEQPSWSPATLLDPCPSAPLSPEQASAACLPTAPLGKKLVAFWET